MRTSLFAVLCTVTLFTSCGGEKTTTKTDDKNTPTTDTASTKSDVVKKSIPKEAPILYKIEDEAAGSIGYVNGSGDTIIALGLYKMSSNDTVTTYGTAFKEDGSCVAFNAEGKELYEVYVYDNGPDYISDGLFRIKKEDKIGYANDKGEIVIEPMYQCAQPFENGQAKVSLTCTIEQDGEHTVTKDAEWFSIDKTGEKVSE